MPWEEAVPKRCVISGTATQTISPSVHRASCSPAGDGGWGTTMAVGNNGDCSRPHHAVGGGSPGGCGRWHQQRAPNQWQVWGARKEVPTGMAKGWCREMLEVWPDLWCCFLCFCREPPPCCSDGVYGVLGGKEGQGWCDQCSPCCQCGYLQAPTADVHGGGLAVFMTCPHHKAGDRSQETLPCFMPTG